MLTLMHKIFILPINDYFVHFQAEEGFEQLTGVDYCSEAVELAKQVATTELESSRIEFLVYMGCVQIV